MLQRIQKILASRGYSSRRAAEKLIEAGAVCVDDKPVTLGDKARANAKITVNSVVVPLNKKKSYYILNKPKGYVTTVKEGFGMKTVMDLVSVSERVYPVGRLDKNSQGLLLLTNDGDLANKLLHPSMGVIKTYKITLDKPFKDSKQLLFGIMIDNRKVQVKSYQRLSSRTIILSIHEGRKHIVRRLMEKLGYKVLKLLRTSFGPLKLRGLKVGELKKLTKEEVKQLQSLHHLQPNVRGKAPRS